MTNDRANAEAVANVSATLQRVLSDLPALTPDQAIQLIRAECRNIATYLDEVLEDSRHI